MSGAVRVLLADDSPTARELLISLVSGDKRFVVVGAARNGSEAVTMVKNLHPDVAVLDIHMPGMDGVQATRHIMSDAPTPVIVVSASVDVRDLAVAFNAERAGAVAARPKPVGPHSDSFERDTTELRFRITSRLISSPRGGCARGQQKQRGHERGIQRWPRGL